MTLLDVYTVIMTACGLFFFLAGSIGLLRFPDVFCRLHALTKADNLGLGLIIFGVLPQTASLFDALQLILIWLLVMVAGAVACHLIANQAVQTLLRSNAGAGQTNTLYDLPVEPAVGPTIEPTINSPVGRSGNGV